LWTPEVNALMKNNWVQLQEIYNSYIYEDRDCRIEIEKGKRHMDLQDALDFIKVSGSKMSTKEAIYCYGMCKMPVAEEVPADDRDQHALQFEGGSIICKKDYFELKLVELVELIGRIAEHLRIGSQEQASKSAHLIDDNYPFIKHVEFVLDEVIWKFLKQRRKEGDNLIMDVSSEEESAIPSSSDDSGNN